MFNLGLRAVSGTCDYTRQPQLQVLSSRSLRVWDDVFRREMRECNQISEQGQNLIYSRKFIFKMLKLLVCYHVQGSDLTPVVHVDSIVYHLWDDHQSNTSTGALLYPWVCGLWLGFFFQKK